MSSPVGKASASTAANGSRCPAGRASAAFPPAFLRPRRKQWSASYSAVSKARSSSSFRRRRTARTTCRIFPTPSSKCIATEDINQARFIELVAAFVQRFAPRKKASAQATVEEQLYELKGDRLGMSLEEFKQKYERSGEGGVRLPLCSDTAWGANKASLRSEPWHQKASIIHARVDMPSEDNSPTVAGVKSELLLYQFVDGKLFRIAALLPTDKFHVISEAAIQKFGPVTRETHKPRQLVWENPIAWVALTRGTVHPPEPSVLELVHRQLQHEADARVPVGAMDI